MWRVVIQSCAKIDAPSISRGIIDLRGKFEKVVLNNHFETRTVQRIKKGKCSRFFLFWIEVQL